MSYLSLPNIVAIPILPVAEISADKPLDERWKTAEFETALNDTRRRWSRRYKFRRN